jgi:hypothetical protein
MKDDETSSSFILHPLSFFGPSIAVVLMRASETDLRC